MEQSEKKEETQSQKELNWAIELLNRLRVKSFQKDITEEDLHEVQMALCKTYDSLPPHPIEEEKGIKEIMNKYIVAEITKSWADGTPVSNLISNTFEEVINVNAGRGYKLIEWKINTIVHSGNVLTETIIAIFKKIEEENIDSLVQQFFTIADRYSYEPDYDEAKAKGDIKSILYLK